MGDRVHTLQCTLRGNNFIFIHLFLVSHAYGHSLSMLSIGLGCMAGVPLVGRSQVILLLSRSSPRILASSNGPLPWTILVRVLDTTVRGFVEGGGVIGCLFHSSPV